jgi:uncharacterized protein YjbI with pentapeptide repeats
MYPQVYNSHTQQFSYYSNHLTWGIYEMRKITAGKLSKILEEHERWCDTDGEEGEQADLYKADLSDAKLQEANLEDADLSRADLSRAGLIDACLRGADLSEADLSGVIGLTVEQLSAALV